MTGVGCVEPVVVEHPYINERKGERVPWKYEEVFKDPEGRIFFFFFVLKSIVDWSPLDLILRSLCTHFRIQKHMGTNFIFKVLPCCKTDKIGDFKGFTTLLTLHVLSVPSVLTPGTLEADHHKVGTYIIQCTVFPENFTSILMTKIK